MVHVLDMALEHVIGFQIDGKIEESEYQKIKTHLLNKMQLVPRLHIYVELRSFEGMDFHAFMKNLRFGFTNLDQFAKEAIVTHKSWVRKIASASNKILPEIDVKAFSFEQIDEAKRWIQQPS